MNETMKYHNLLWRSSTSFTVSFARKSSTMDNVPYEETILARIDSHSRHDGTRFLLSLKLVLPFWANDGRIPKVFEMKNMDDHN